jgi:hypothetical protein
MALRKKLAPFDPSYALQRHAEAADSVRREVRQVDLMEGRNYSATVPAGGSAEVGHGLGRVPKRVLMTDFPAGVASITRTAWDADSVTWANSAGSDVDITYKLY